ncbi:MAG: hypothetical protein ABIR24_01355 [Verrucomicrobiota bacterium]
MAIVCLVTLALSAMPVVAETSSVSTTVTTSRQTAPTLSYGAANVLKLAQATVGEEIILAYVQKSGQGYGDLGASEIIYLRDAGVSDRVISTMLAQEKKSRDTAVAQQPAPQQTVAPAQASRSAPVVAAPQYQQTYYAPPPVTYVQPAPAPLIVMRDSSPRLVDYGIYPRYGYGGYPSYGYSSYGCSPSYGYRSYGNYYPNVSFSVGFGGHHSGFGFSSSGFRGGYCR